VILLVVVSTFAGCGGFQRGEEIRVGVATNYPPIVFEKDGKVRGVEADLAELVGDELNRPVRFVRLEWGELIPALTAGSIDVIMAGMSVTEQRKRYVSFTKPYLRIGQMALIRWSEVRRLTPVNKMFHDPVRVGFERGTTGEVLALRALERAQIFPFGSVADGLAALRGGTIDYFVHDAPTVWTHASPSPSEGDLAGLYRPLSEEYLAWAVRKSDRMFEGELNLLVDRIRSDGRLRDILDRWVGDRIEVR
jgi:ABC-type amino acid transport substrate-binding protein